MPYRKHYELHIEPEFRVFLFQKSSETPTLPTVP